MSSDVRLVKKLMDKGLYKRVSPYIKEYAVAKETWDFIQSIGTYYRNYPAEDSIDLGKFTILFRTVHGKKMEKSGLYDIFLDKLKTLPDEDDDAVEDVLRNYITKDYAAQIMNKAAAIVSGTEGNDMDDIRAIYEMFGKELGRTVSYDDLFVAPDLSYLVTTKATEGFHWRLNELNISLGPIRQGDFIVVSARPETGKTTFVASEVANFCSQNKSGRPIVWVNNEERSSKVMSRVIQAYHGVNQTTLESNPAKYAEMFQKDGGLLLKILDDDTGMNSVRKLDALFEDVNPCLIVFDQLDKVAGFTKSEREDLRLGHVYQWARELAKKYGPTIAISQASESADHSTYITMNMLRGSKTDKAGEADAIITIGRDKENEYRRYIHVPKNKLCGGPLTREEMRHGYFEVDINPELARYIGVY